VHSEALRSLTDQFFDDFDAAFATFDGAVIAQRYSAPYLAIRADGSAECFATPQAVAGYFQGVVDGYRRQGCRSCRHRDQAVCEVGGAAVFATVTWELLDAGGGVRASWRESYNLVLAGSRLLACASMDHAP
jgi:hypothetical protein